jgi:hypothetical protein
MAGIDILICHTEQDNEGHWIDNFKKFVELMLTQVLGETPNIVLKPETEQISEADLKDVKVLIPVLSGSYMESGECLDTLEAYINKIGVKAKVKYQDRVFKVLKSPIAYDKQPTKLRDQLGYDFYKVDYESGEIQEFKDYFSTEAERNYWMRLVDLAYDIHESLLLLEGGASNAEVKPIFSRKSIYLAETGHDLVVQKNIIRRELLRHGYNVLPNHSLSSSYQGLGKNISEELAQCTLSIHLVGNSYGEIPEGSDRSIVDIQNRLAAEISSKTKGTHEELSRLIWISPELNNISEQQRSFIDNIKRDTSSLEGAEILQTPLEDFKNIIRNELLESGIDKKLSANLANDGADDVKKVYLIHDKIDEANIKHIKEKIEKSGCKVISPVFEGGLLELREQHISNLRHLDAAIIYKGKVNDQWVRMKMLDILKAPGFGRNKPVLGKAIVTAPGGDIDKEHFSKNEVEIITGDEKSINEALSYFLDSIK